MGCVRATVFWHLRLPASRATLRTCSGIADSVSLHNRGPGVGGPHGAVFGFRLVGGFLPMVLPCYSGSWDALFLVLDAVVGCPFATPQAVVHRYPFRAVQLLR